MCHRELFIVDRHALGFSCIVLSPEIVKLMIIMLGNHNDSDSVQPQVIVFYTFNYAVLCINYILRIFCVLLVHSCVLPVVTI